MISNGYELWKSDGTANRTVMVKDIYSGGSSSPSQLVAVGNTLYFRANDGIMEKNYGKVMVQQMER
jgi:trimeric autotransporter adhesin